MPYTPITEDISPASPVTGSRDDGGFKTPFNTPGLFENIKDSVLKSRSRLLKSTSTLSVVFAETFGQEKGLKRRRESTGESTILNKRRKIQRSREDSKVSIKLWIIYCLLVDENETYTRKDILDDKFSRLVVGSSSKDKPRGFTEACVCQQFYIEGKKTVVILYL